MHISQTPRPWHRQPLVWMLIAIPLAAIIMGIVTVYLAVSTDDGLVTDDYYKRGKQINRVLARDQAAARYGLASEVHLNVRSGRLAATLQAASGYRLPPALELQLLHSTRSGLDQRLALTREPNGVYGGTTQVLPPGHWHVQLSADDWRLTGSLHVASPDAGQPAPNDLSVTLHAQQ